MKVFRSDKGSPIKVTECKEDPTESEEVIHDMVKHNLSKIFNDLEFLQSEFSVGGLRMDSIAFDHIRKAFVIIEYKNIKSKSVVDQGISYDVILDEHREAFLQLYSKHKRKILDKKDIKWEESRLIFISPEFTKHQKIASRHRKLPIEIEMYEISRYKNNIIILNRIGDDKKKFVNNYSTLKESTNYDEKVYLDKKTSTKTRKIYEKLRDRILETFPELEIGQRAVYVGFYNSNDNSAVCTIEARKSKLRLCYSTRINKGVLSPDPPFVKDMSKTGHNGLGDLMSEITKEEEIEKAIPLIRRVYHRRNELAS